MEAVIAKVEARLPLIFKDTQLGQVLTTLSSASTDVIWHHMKNIHMQATGSSSHVEETRGKYGSMAAANAAWSLHYERRVVQRCRRRSRLVGDATQGTPSEIVELFAELDNTKQHGFGATSNSVADEAGDVWYGARCYAVAYSEQARLVLDDWVANFRRLWAVAASTDSDSL